jgi:GAF domain-containing protein
MPREALLIRTLVDLADNLVDDFDVIDVLTMLSDRCVQTLDVASAGVMLAAPSGELQVVASSSDTMRDLEIFELQANEGPCVDCFRSGRAVHLDLATIDGRWPLFTARAIEAGFYSVHALPMHLRGRVIGAINMFRTDPGGLEEADVLAGQALADVATIAILQHQAVVDGQTLNNQLNQALNSRIIIEQAKGMVSEAVHLDMDQAFQRLRHHARNHGLRLTDVCVEIVNGTMTGGSLDALPAARRGRPSRDAPVKPRRTTAGPADLGTTPSAGDGT